MILRRRSLAVVLAVAPIFLAHCSSEPAGDDGTGGTPSAGSGNPTGGTATGGTTSGAGGSAGGASGSAGSGTSGSSATGGSGGASGSAGSGAGGSGTSGMGGGGGSGGSNAGSNGGGAGGSAGSVTGGSGGGGAFVLTSSKIVTDMEMSADFTCTGDAHSPPLAWTGAPAGTMSFAMVFVDTTIINANMMDTRGYHSAIWDIPASVSALPENLPVGAMLTSPVMAKQFNPLRAAYLGPCPNNGAAPADTYEFRLFALPVTTLTGQLNSVRAIFQSIMAANPLGTAVLRAKSDATGTLH